jgi:hypothetical protein
MVHPTASLYDMIPYVTPSVYTPVRYTPPMRDMTVREYNMMLMFLMSSVDDD